MDITLCPKCCVRVLPTSESRGPGYQSDLTHAGIVVMDAFSQPSAPSTEPSEVNRQSTGGNCCRMPTGQRLRLALKRFVIFELILIGVPGLLAVLFLLSIALRLAFLLLGIIQLGLMTLVLPARRLCPWGFADDFLGVLPKDALGWYALFGAYTALAILLAWCTAGRRKHPQRGATTDSVVGH